MQWRQPRATCECSTHSETLESERPGQTTPDPTRPHRPRAEQSSLGKTSNASPHRPDQTRLKKSSHTHTQTEPDQARPDQTTLSERTNPETTRPVTQAQRQTESQTDQQETN
jgi:hypothetical protein